VSEQHLCRFVSYLASDKVKHTSIKCYLSAIRNFQIANNLPDPNISAYPKLESVIRGIKKEQAKLSPPRPQRLPITVEILYTLKALLEARARDPDAPMLWAAITTCFFGFMRSGEITVPSESAFDPSSHLCLSDVLVDDLNSPKIVKLNLKASKSDPFRKGVEIVLGTTCNNLFPVSALLSYLAIWGSQPGFLFLFKNGRPLTKGR